MAALTVQQHESMAVQDLRHVSAAETVFNTTMGEGRYYYPPDRLADPTVFARYKVSPFLPGYFVQPLRQGYNFEFLGEKPQPARGVLEDLGQLYESFVYVATRRSRPAGAVLSGTVWCFRRPTAACRRGRTRRSAIADT
jgi:hypothetical protein